ncbi:CNNM domain-containing protein [Pseudohongiella sp. SYSU M77423]|uniref:CNNM domain-containing protein n=1 Tax=Pseudohongiella sp. SYSU M77423 TaxID=3042312 RepID=UPI0024811AE6|nr:CNNM domain-containing protein [Pseudohongiella sp. SYSU M77423]MDH7942474.1 CNNM domain-containing protein [Pseudohongiella sp. SYSU M77423]
MGLLLLFALLSICVSFICSLLEAALLSLTPSHIVRYRDTNPALYEKLRKLKDRIDQPLAAILTLNTVAHTFGAAGVGAQVGVVFGDGYLGAASAVMTFLVLVLSEIIPKTLGARHWQTLVPILPTTLGVMIMLLKPFIKMSDKITEWMGEGNPEVDLRSEIKALTSLGRDTDQLDEDERRVIGNILDLHEVQIKDIMTPRTVCEYMSLNATVSEILDEMRNTAFSRYPVLDDNDHPQGIVFRAEILDASPETPLSELIKPVKVVTDEVSAEAVLGNFLHEHQHMGLVYDQYGTWLGLVTMEDLLETILGQSIMDETDDIPNMRRFARKRWENRLKHHTVKERQA